MKTQQCLVRLSAFGLLCIVSLDNSSAQRSSGQVLPNITEIRLIYHVRRSALRNLTVSWQSTETHHHRSTIEALLDANGNYLPNLQKLDISRIEVEPFDPPRVRKFEHTVIWKHPSVRHDASPVFVTGFGPEDRADQRHTLITHDGERLFYEPDRAWASIHPAPKLGHFSEVSESIPFLAYGFNWIDAPEYDVLRMETTAEGEMIVVGNTDWVRPNTPDMRYEYYLDANRDYIPIMRREIETNGQLISEIRLRYAHLQGAIVVPFEAMYITMDLLLPSVQRSEILKISHISANDSIPHSTFEIDFPPGTQVQYNSRSRELGTYTVAAGDHGKAEEWIREILSDPDSGFAAEREAAEAEPPLGEVGVAGRIKPLAASRSPSSPDTISAPVAVRPPDTPRSPILFVGIVIACAAAMFIYFRYLRW